MKRLYFVLSSFFVSALRLEFEVHHGGSKKNIPDGRPTGATRTIPPSSRSSKSSHQNPDTSSKSSKSSHHHHPDTSSKSSHHHDPDTSSESSVPIDSTSSHPSVDKPVDEAEDKEEGKEDEKGKPTHARRHWGKYAMGFGFGLVAASTTAYALHKSHEAGEVTTNLDLRDNPPGMGPGMDTELHTIPPAHEKHTT